MAAPPLRPRNYSTSFLALASFTLLSACSGPPGPVSGPGTATAEEAEPIAYIGHGAFFERDGRQIAMTVQIRGARPGLVSPTSAGRPGQGLENQLGAFEGRLFEGVPAQGQTRLILQQRSLLWLAARSRRGVDHRIAGKLNALTYLLQWQLPDGGGEPATAQPFALHPALWSGSPGRNSIPVK